MVASLGIGHTTSSPLAVNRTGRRNGSHISRRAPPMTRHREPSSRPMPTKRAPHGWSSTAPRGSVSATHGWPR